MSARLRALVAAEGSSRPAALMRIGLGLVCWSRFANDFALFHDRPWLWGALGASIYLSSTLLIVGWKSRFAALWTALTIATIVLFLGVKQRHYGLVHHHVSLLMITVGLLALTPCGRSFSVDRWLALRRAAKGGPPPPPERGPLWGVTLIALQTSAVYAWGAIDKTHYGWFSGERIQHIWMYFYSGSDKPDIAGYDLAAQISGIATVLFEYLLAFGLFVRRWHRWLLPAAVVFHAGIYFTMPVATFTATMYVLYLAYLDPAQVHRVVDRLVQPARV